MTPTLVRHHLPQAGAAPRVDLCARARDWSEIQERMLVPLYEAVYERLEVGPATRLLGLGCGSGLALLMAASRGAAVTGVDSSPERLALARARLQPGTRGTRTRAAGPARTAARARIVEGSPADAADPRTPAYTLVTAFDPVGCRAEDTEQLDAQLTAAAPLAERGAAVVLVGWGPPERCATSGVLRVAAAAPPSTPTSASASASASAETGHGAGWWRGSLRDDLEEAAARNGLRPDGSGRVACPFGYADTDSAVRGLMSTGLFDRAVAAADLTQVGKELAEALQPFVRRGGTVWMPNVFRYLVARVP